LDGGNVNRQEQTVELKFWPYLDEKPLLQKLEEIGRNAYQSFERTSPDSCYRFVEMIIKKKHLGILEHELMTFKITTNRAIANELVRHRIASYVQESTRYVNYDKKDPAFITFGEMDIWQIHKVEEDFKFYSRLVNAGISPEIARDYLPLGLKTTIYATQNIRAWFHFLAMRSTPEAHPLMRKMAEQITQELRITIPLITEKMLEIGEN
jgi:thymidylate synthase (FAD)